MHINHIALWTQDLERLKDFYVRYFHCHSSERYFNAVKQFSSYFLTFENGARLEIMHRPGISEKDNIEKTGIAHFAISVGSKEDVDTMTSMFEKSGFKIAGYPRTTGDG